MFRTLPFPFPGGTFPSGLGAVIQRTVLSGERAALEVTHTDDNSWLVADGVSDPNEPGAAIATHMHHVVERDPSVAVLATLPVGHTAVRDRADAPWVIYRHRWPDDE